MAVVIHQETIHRHHTINHLIHTNVEGTEVDMDVVDTEEVIVEVIAVVMEVDRTTTTIPHHQEEVIIVVDIVVPRTEEAIKMLDSHQAVILPCNTLHSSTLMVDHHKDQWACHQEALHSTSTMIHNLVYHHLNNNHNKVQNIIRTTHRPNSKRAFSFLGLCEIQNYLFRVKQR